MADQNFSVWRGNAYRVIGWQFPFDLAGSEIVLTIQFKGGGGTITKTTEDGGLKVISTLLPGEIAPVPVVFWDITKEESRSLPLGRGSRYEIERKSAIEERTYVSGWITAEGGINSD